MYFVYILYSESFDRFYVGQTNNLKNRLEKHNQGAVKSTKSYSPWKMVYHETFPTRSEAMKKEKIIKSWKSKIKITELVKASR